jgi:RimJ/RimL family protein N-acetyltransferase
MKPLIVLRQWDDSDFEAFASMNADVEVMKFFARTLTAEESRETLQRFKAGIEQRGWGLWAVQVDGNFAGFTGLSEPGFSAHFTPCVEIGWRLRQEYWGQGIAFTAAQQAADHAFSVLRLDQLVSFTTATNSRSRRLMERLGFSHDTRDDFMHPLLEDDHYLRHHVLYRKQRAAHIRPLP